MKRLIKSIETPLLLLLVCLALWQFVTLMNNSQDIYRTLKAVPEPKGGQQTEELDLSFFAVPPRIIAHLPNGEAALLRSSSAYFQTIWSTVLNGSFRTVANLNFAQLRTVSAAEWNTNQPSLVLMLSAPTPLDLFCDSLGIRWQADAREPLPVINRIYVSAALDNTVLLEDAEAQVYYAMPLVCSASVLYTLLEVTQESVYYAIQPIPLESYGFRSVNPIYGYRTNLYAAAREVTPMALPELDVLAGRFFEDTAMVRTYTDSSDTVTYYDGQRTMKLPEYTNGYVELQLQQSVSAAATEQSPLRAVVAMLNLLQLWPHTSEYLYDGMEVTGDRCTSYYTLISNGKPIYCTVREGVVGGSLSVESKGSEVSSMQLSEPILGASQRQYLAISGSNALWRLWWQWSQLFGSLAFEDMPLRDVYEGYLVNEQQDSVETVWIIEFYNGCKVFYNMINGEYAGMQAAVEQR
ncbi:MAG: hypothetical protein LLG09_07665 [Negativicutes bacterium]|nr:hypothetical protein [Negativicutes bacterium]